MGQLQTIEQQVLELGFQILAVSPDRPEKLLETVEKNDLNYTVLSDRTMKAAKALGLAFRVDDAMFEKLKGYGIDIEQASGESHRLLPVPAVFVIGKDRIIRFQYANPNYPVRIDPEVVLAAVKAHNKEMEKR